MNKIEGWGDLFSFL